jgi:hypothetical protein
MSRRIVDAWTYIVVLATMSAILTIAHFWPTSFWFKVGRVHIDDARVGKSPSLVLDREIVRPFRADWDVTIRRWEGGWVPWCNAPGSGNYRPDSRLPKDMNLVWWTSGQCQPLPAGKFTVTATWTITGLGIMPDKTVSLESNVFEVRE